MTAPELPAPALAAEVVALADELVALPDAPFPPGEREGRLRVLLDRLALAFHAVDAAELANDEGPEPATGGYAAVRARFAAAFPDLGLYPAVLDTDALEPKVTLGDALDDLTDLALDLQEVADRARSSADDALWHFRFGFRTHWGAHLRWLQLYLHRRAF